MTGAQFEIRIDHTPRTYRDRKDFAMEAASFLKSRNPHSVVEVRDLKSGEVTAMTRSDRAASLKEAKAQFQKSWDAWKAWAMLEEVP